MEILVIMCAGVAVGRFLFPKKWKGANEKLQIVCTLALIFSMGVTLGRRENFLGEVATVGWQSFLFFLLPTVLSVVCVVFLTRRFLEKKKGDKEE